MSDLNNLTQDTLLFLQLVENISSHFFTHYSDAPYGISLVMPNEVRGGFIIAQHIHNTRKTGLSICFERYPQKAYSHGAK